MLCLVKCDEGRFLSSVFKSWRKPKISEVQVRVCRYWQRLVCLVLLKFKSKVCVGGCCVLKNSFFTVCFVRFVIHRQ